MFFLEAQKSVDASDESEDIRNGSLAFSWARARGHTRCGGGMPSCMHKTLADSLVPRCIPLSWIHSSHHMWPSSESPSLSLSVSHATHAQDKL